MPYETQAQDREFITKVWGAEEVLVNNDKYCSKILHIRNRYRCSLHYHPTKDETFIALEGMVKVEYSPVPYNKKHEAILSGKFRDAIHIPPNTLHRFQSFAGDAMLLEVSTPHSDEDVVRLEPSGEIPT
jgi:mannose-6-phosphate isomerase-like protein (cupin superfamily)